MKPGYKTIAFYGGLCATILALLTGGEVIEGGIALKLVTTVATVLGAAGFTAWRRFVKPSDSTKSPIKTSEFWLTCAAVLVGALYTSGAFTMGGPADKVLGVVATLLAALGYTVPKDVGAGPAGDK